MFIDESIAAIKINGLLEADSLSMITDRIIYNSISDFPVLKVITDFSSVNYKTIWKRLRIDRHTLSSQESKCLFLLIHNKLPVPERLHRIGMRDNPYCILCPGMVSDICHYFCTSTRMKDIWSWLCSKISKIINFQQGSEWKVLNLAFFSQDQT